MDKDKVLSLAKLARIKIDDTEAENLSREFDAILKYVSEVKEISATSEQHTNKPENVGIFNVMREDSEGHESGIYTEKILNEAPARQDNFIKVKKIL